MKMYGNLMKMKTEIVGDVQYNLFLGNDVIAMNSLIGKCISLTNLHRINCIKCGNITRTSFAQGFCYPCFVSVPETEDCVLRPELCKAHEGVSRDMNYATGYCLIDHFVYLALAGGVKVGVTRHTQVPVRWIDQGAEEAVIIARTPNRYLAGCIEVALKHHIRDKTNWRIMLSGECKDRFNLIGEKEKAISFLHPDFQKFAVQEEQITRIYYPVIEYPQKVKSISLDNTENINDILTGIKGQYLLFRSGIVLNIRKYSGYLIELEY